MPKAILYHIRPTVDRQGGLAQKFPRLLEKAGLSEVVNSGDLTAVKMHFGEPGNVRYVRPIFPVMLVDALLKLGARPFVTDTVVLYKSKRQTTWGYHDVARRHGFTSEVLGCPLIIAGGMSDRSVKVNVPQPMQLEEIGVTPEIYDADVLISLAHVTLHMQYPVGAALKNIAMGCVDISTKLAMHEARGTKPRLIAQQEATVDVAAGVLKASRKKFFGINLILDITPDCDCWNRTELPVVPDLGIIAGTDPVALDRASYDLIVASPGYPGSKLEGSEGYNPGGEKVKPIYPKVDPSAYFDIVDRAGIGSSEYEIEDL